jgi:hypothetical protein
MAKALPNMMCSSAVNGESHRRQKRHREEELSVISIRVVPGFPTTNSPRQAEARLSHKVLVKETEPGAP